jgi:hypothetical protein
LANNNHKGAKVKVVEVKFMRRRNLGNYEHAELQLTTLIEEGQDVDAAIVKTKLMVSAHLASLDKEGKVEPKKETKPAVEAEIKEPKKKAKVAKDKVEEEVKEYTIADIKGLLQEVAKKVSLAAAQEVLQEIAGVTHSKDLKEENYQAVGQELEKCLK